MAEECLAQQASSRFGHLFELSSVDRPIPVDIKPLEDIRRVRPAHNLLDDVQRTHLRLVRHHLALRCVPNTRI